MSLLQPLELRSGVFILLAWLITKPIMRPRKLHPVTADMRRELSVATLAKAGGFRQAMRFPLLDIETARDHIRIFSLHDRKRPPEIICISVGGRIFFAHAAAHGAVFFITTAYFAIVGAAVA
jgi:hypothetical protein